MDSLFDRYYKHLVVFAYAYLNDWAETEDLVQEQLVKLWQRFVDKIVLRGVGIFFIYCSKKCLY
ncbi:MAG: sigma factor [Odoribacter sp.]